MKKITISFISLTVIVMAAVLVVNHSYSAKNPLLTEIASALADDPNTGDEECPDDPNGGGGGHGILYKCKKDGPNCDTKCPKCHSVHLDQTGAKGPSYDVSGTCTCGYKW